VWGPVFRSKQEKKKEEKALVWPLNWPKWSSVCLQEDSLWAGKGKKEKKLNWANWLLSLGKNVGVAWGLNQRA